MKRHHRILALSCALLAVVSCDEDVADVIVFLPPCGPSPKHFAIGDTVRLIADAHAAEPVFLGTFLYSSVNSPGRFQWSVDPVENATVVKPGMIVVRREGATRVLATTEGVEGSAEFIAEVPSVSVTVDAPAQVRVGDTLTIRFTATDTSGAEVPPASSPSINHQPSINMHPVGGPQRERDRRSYLATRAGRVDVDWCSSWRTGSFSLTIAPR